MRIEIQPFDISGRFIITLPSPDQAISSWLTGNAFSVTARPETADGPFEIVFGVYVADMLKRENQHVLVLSIVSVNYLEVINKAQFELPFGGNAPVLVEFSPEILEMETAAEVSTPPVETHKEEPQQPEGDTDLAAKKSMSIDDLGFTPMILQKVRQSGLSTVGEFTSRTQSELRQLKGIGPRILQEVGDKLQEMGLSFRKE